MRRPEGMGREFVKIGFGNGVAGFRFNVTTGVKQIELRRALCCRTQFPASDFA